MTAIFALWNTNGFSMASDSNQTITEPGQTWIDPIQKIFAIKNHQVAFGGAGRAKIDSVDVNEIVASWTKSLSSPLEYLEDYVIHFLNWLNDQELPDDSNDEGLEELEASIKDCFNVLNEECQNFKNLKSSEIADFLAQRLPKKYIQDLNIFGNRIEELEVNNFQYDLESDKLKFEKILKINRAVVEHRAVSDSYKRNWTDWYTKCFEKAAEVFPSIIGEEFDFDCEWHLGIVDHFIEVRENYVYPEATFARCMLIGYGEKDWIPKAIQFKILDSDFGIRQVSIETVADPRFTWYMSLGISAGVSDLARGFSSDFHDALINISADTNGDETSEDVARRLFELGSKRTGETLRRLDTLTVRRLEFVARLFVELEALKSYLNEPLPGVGGDVQYVTMTKNSVKSGVYLEYH